MSESVTGVLIVGAGASGLTLACDLRRRGLACRVVEKRDEPFPGSRGKGLQPRTLEVFEDLGVVDAITAAGGPFPPFRGRKARRVLWERDLATVMGLAPLVPDASAPYSMWMIPQAATEAILRARLATLAGTVEMATELVGFESGEDGVRATLSTASGLEQVRASYLVGCDGGHSFVRKHAGIAFSGEAGAYRSVIADVELAGLDRGHWHIWLRSESSLDRVALCALPGSELFQFSAPVSEAELNEVSLEALERLFAERSEGFPLRLKRIAWSTIYRLNVRLAERFRQGRVLLAGDSAHVHSPFGGQGLNTSIQDAYNLGWKLEAALRGFPQLLDSYEEERRPVAADVLGLSSELQRENYDRVVKEAAVANNRDIYQLKLGYRGTSLSVEARATRGRVQAGDRAPDAPCALASGMPKRLFELFRGPHWTVLQFAGRSERPTNLGPRVKWLDVSGSGGQGQIVDRDGLIAQAYDVQPMQAALLAIRPDGYVGMACDEAPLLVEYLRRVGC